jgi:hypothetical protein
MVVLVQGEGTQKDSAGHVGLADAVSMNCRTPAHIPAREVI